jgi:hypothetical protein
MKLGSKNEADVGERYTGGTERFHRIVKQLHHRFTFDRIRTPSQDPENAKCNKISIPIFSANDALSSDTE